ncbi:MAG: chloride channel protein [Acidimicrobiia bacterium]
MKIVPRLDARRAELKRLATRSREVVVLAALVGAATGALVALFETIVVNGVQDHYESVPVWCRAFMPGLGLASAWLILRTVGRSTSPATSDEYLHAFHDRHHHLDARAFAARAMAALTTVSSGAAMGLEGPSLYFGSFIGSSLQRRLPGVFRDSDRRTLLVAGAAAGVAAIFKAPATGVVFALEVPYRDDLARRMLLPALVAAASGYLVFVAVHGTTPLFDVGGNPSFSFADLAGAAALGVAAGLGARVFAKMIRHGKALAQRPAALRLPLVAVSLAALYALGRWATGEDITLTGGYNVVRWAQDPAHGARLLALVLVLRCLVTSIALTGGGVGGVFIPLVAAGALMGRIVDGWIGGAEPTLFTVIGVTAFLGAGYRVPLAAVMFVAETTGRPGFIVPALIAAVASELVMGTASVTAYQRDPGAR